MSQIAVLLDTDIASDINDAVALAYLLKKTDCELLGISAAPSMYNASNESRL